jgi:hypothetical protein
MVVTVSELKEHLRIQHDEEDVYLSTLSSERKPLPRTSAA